MSAQSPVREASSLVFVLIYSFGWWHFFCHMVFCCFLTGFERNAEFLVCEKCDVIRKLRNENIKAKT